LIQTKKMNNELSIDISKLKVGMYFISIINGMNTENIKFVKK
jgi:hypothetical protein